MSIAGRILPNAKKEYDQLTFQELIDYIKLLETRLYMQGKHIEIYGVADSAGRRPDLIMQSPNGSKWAIRVDNAGAVTTTAL